MKGCREKKFRYIENSKRLFRVIGDNHQMFMRELMQHISKGKGPTRRVLFRGAMRISKDSEGAHEVIQVGGGP